MECVFLAGTSYSLSQILSQAHAYAIYYDTKYLSITFNNIHLLNVDSKFRDTEYEVSSPQESQCISIDQNISGQK